MDVHQHPAPPRQRKIAISGRAATPDDTSCPQTAITARATYVAEAAHPFGVRNLAPFRMITV